MQIFLRSNRYGALLLAPLLFTHWNTAHATDVNAQCAANYGSNFTPVTGQVVAQTPNLPRPLKGVVQMDPDFKSCVVRATDHAVEPPSTAFTRNDYARRQAFNANNTRFIAYASGGDWVLYDANSLAFIRILSGPAADAEPQWDPVDPSSLYYVPTNGGMKLFKLNVDTNVSTVAADFTGRLPWAGVARTWTHSEGSPSADGRYWCLLAENSNFGPLGVFTYDLQTNTILGTKALSVSPDWVSMTPSGRSCVVSGTTAYNRTFTTARTLLNGSEHADLAVGADGDDYYVYVDFADTGYVRMVDIDTGVNTPLFPTYINGATTSLHISGKAFSRPGWALISTFNHSGTTEQWLHERVMAFELKANPKLINLAHHHSYYNEYWTQPQASVSRDFSHIMFTSNWGSTSATDVDDYMIRLSDNTFGGSTPTGDTTNPTVTASESGSSGTITLAAAAADNVGVTGVDFMVDGVLKGSDSSSPYSLALPSSTLSNSSHSLVAIAYDAAANAGTSAPIAFSINNTTADTTAPTVSAAESGTSGTITVSATANDNVGVSRVDFLVDGVLKGSDSSSPYSLALASSTLSNGSHSLVAVAYDAAGNAGTSVAVPFSVNNTGSDATAPTVSAAESGTSGNITLLAKASDNVAVSRVDFWVDGTLSGSDTSKPYSRAFDSTKLSNGVHNLVAKAYDVAGNVGTSPTVIFSTSNSGGTTGGADTTAPSVSGGSVAVATGSITMSAVASDNVGVTHVDFWVDGVAKGGDSSSPYSLYWDTTSWAAGSTHSMVAKAYDAAGNVSSTAPVSFTIK